MNIFELSLTTSAIVGGATGWKISSPGPWLSAGFVSLGIIVGLLVYAISVLPSIAMFKSDRTPMGTKRSPLRSAAEVGLLLGGCGSAPILTYYVSLHLLTIVNQWVS